MSIVFPETALFLQNGHVHVVLRKREVRGLGMRLVSKYVLKLFSYFHVKVPCFLSSVDLSLLIQGNVLLNLQLLHAVML